MVVHGWELRKAQKMSTNKIKNLIWSNVSNGQPIPGEISVEALRVELIRRGEEPKGYHNT